MSFTPPPGDYLVQGGSPKIANQQVSLANQFGFAAPQALGRTDVANVDVAAVERQCQANLEAMRGDLRTARGEHRVALEAEIAAGEAALEQLRQEAPAA